MTWEARRDMRLIDAQWARRIGGKDFEAIQKVRCPDCHMLHPRDLHCAAQTPDAWLVRERNDDRYFLVGDAHRDNAFILDASRATRYDSAELAQETAALIPIACEVVAYYERVALNA